LLPASTPAVLDPPHQAARERRRRIEGRYVGIGAVDARCDGAPCEHGDFAAPSSRPGSLQPACAQEIAHIVGNRDPAAWLRF
jgi:hypothetical protein